MKFLLVCDDEKIGQDLETKLVLLRKNDKVLYSAFKNAINDVVINNPDVILVCENSAKEDIVNLIKTIKNNTENPVILVPINNNQDFILSCFDAGINDFIPINTQDYEFVIRIINNIRFNLLKEKNAGYFQILEQLKVADEFTGLINYDYSKQFIENYIDNNMITTGSLMIISPTNDGKINYETEKLVSSVKLSVRNSDLITLGKGINIYIFMPFTDMSGAVSVLNKIKENLDFEICAGISDISGKNFDKFEKEALRSHAESVALGTEFKLAENRQEETLDDWVKDKSSKDFKIFKQMFNKKLEKVITPVFYRLQNVYEEKLIDTKIEQYVDENNCVFNLKNKKGNSSLTIIYPGFGKITILINHEGLDSPENREIKLPLSKITEQELVGIIEDFIKEYKENVIG